MPDLSHVALEMDIGEKDLASLQQLAGGHGKDFVVQMIDRIFDAKGTAPKRRFSNGFPALYTALEPETAIAEMKFWSRRLWAQDPANQERVGHYVSVKVAFVGLVKDIRTLVEELPALIHKTDYTLCNEIGKKTRAEGLDALLAASARRRSGTCVPVFRRRAVKAGGVVEQVLFMQGQAKGAVRVRRTPV